MKPTEKNITWVVWNDPFAEDILAVEAASMTVELSASLEKEKIAILKVNASDRHTAVRLAFPDAYEAGALKVTTPKPRPRLH